MRIFVSSSFEDLKDHRASAIRVLRQLGHEVIAMEDMTAGSLAPLAKVLEMVDRKIAGRRTVTHAKPERPAASGEVVNLLEALRASLQGQAKREQLPPRKPVVRAVPPAAQGAVGKPAAPRKARTSK